MAQTRYYSQVFEDSETEELIDIYADEGITGTREDKRDEFQRMLKDCRKGKNRQDLHQVNQPLCPKYKGLSEERKRIEIPWNYDIF